MSAHTKGPWTAEDKRPNGSGIDIAGADDVWIGTVMGSHDNMQGFPSDQECEANARLFVVAPVLLAELESMLNRYVDLVNGGDCGNWDPDEEPAVIAARAAIALAKVRP